MEGHVPEPKNLGYKLNMQREVVFSREKNKWCPYGQPKAMTIILTRQLLLAKPDLPQLNNIKLPQTESSHICNVS